MDIVVGRILTRLMMKKTLGVNYCPGWISLGGFIDAIWEK